MNLNKFLCLSWSRKALVPWGKEAAEFSIYGEQNPRFNTLWFKNIQQACLITQQENVPKYEYNDSYFLSLFKAHWITVVCHLMPPFICLFLKGIVLSLFTLPCAKTHVLLFLAVEPKTRVFEGSSQSMFPYSDSSTATELWDWQNN